jgi:hypothetical protein
MRVLFEIKYTQIAIFFVSCRGEILRPLGGTGSVPQTIVFRYKEIGIILCTKHQKKNSKYTLEGKNTISSVFRKQYTPDFCVAEYLLLLAKHHLRLLLCCYCLALTAGPSMPVLYSTTRVVLYNNVAIHISELMTQVPKEHA